MKIRVTYSDGVYRGSLFKTYCYNDLNCKVWHAPPHPHYAERLINIAGIENPCDPKSWFLLRISTLDIEECTEPDDYASRSQAIHITDLEARNWFSQQGFTYPSMDETAHMDIPARERLSPPLQDVFDALDGKAMTGPVLAKLLFDNETRADTIRKRIASINLILGEDTISHNRSRGKINPFGYYRPDALPTGSHQAAVKSV